MRLTRKILQARLRDYTMGFFGQMGYANKAGALAVAGIALLSIITTPSHDFEPRIIYWASGLMLVTVSLVSWTIHPIFVGSVRMTIFDTIVPLLTATAEYLFFGILVWTKDVGDLHLWMYFPLAVVVQAFTSFVLVLNRFWLFGYDEDFGDELRAVKQKMKASLWGSALATSSATCVYGYFAIRTFHMHVSVAQEIPHLDWEPFPQSVDSIVQYGVPGFSLFLLLMFSISTFRFIREVQEMVADDK